jgi:GNAT superfamily N-acetyltransferase
MVEIRPMGAGDVDAVLAVVNRAGEAVERRAGRVPDTLTEEQRAHMRMGTERFIERDAGGAWVAVEGDAVIGMAEAIRRGSFWGLAMLFVDPGSQSLGVGRRLLDRALGYADGATLRMILTSSDPRALRRYSLAGLAIHPAVGAAGTIDRSAIPNGLPGRHGGAADIDLVADVDSRLRGSRAEDVEFLLSTGARIEVVDGPSGRGFAVHSAKRLIMLGATDRATAAHVLWRVLAEVDGTFEIWGMTAAQDWAVKVALAARLEVGGAGPLFVGGLKHPPGPWLPSGWYF